MRVAQAMQGTNAWNEEGGRRRCRVMRLVALRLSGCWLFLLPAGALADGPALRTYDSKYYEIHSDLPEAEVREAGLRMTKVVEACFVRLPGVEGKIERRLPLYLYANAA